MFPCCLLPCCVLSGARCPLSFPHCLLSAACCMLHVACYLARCTSLLFAAYCPLHGACCLDVVCRRLHFSRCIFPRCTLHVVCCLLHSFQWSLACCPSRLVCGIAVRRIVSAARCLLSVAYRTLSVVRCLLPVACPSVPCRMVCAVCRLTRVASRHVACCVLYVLSCMLSLCPLPVPSSLATLQSDTAPSCTQRIAEALAIVRPPRPAADRSVRARVRAWVHVGSKVDGVSLWVSVRA
jgi:hypothetical protein